MNKTALAITIVLSIFILIIVAGVYYGVKVAQPVSAADIPTTVATDIPAATDAPAATQSVADQVQLAIQQRDAAYQDLINQANTRLDTLQKENQTLQAQLNAVQASPPQASAPVTNAPAGITADQAVQVAAAWTGDNQIYSVESVTIRDTPLYKVTFSAGVVVYVSLDGQVVGSQMPLMNVNNPSTVVRRSGGGEGGDHEGGDD